MEPDSRPTLRDLDDLVRQMDHQAEKIAKPETCDCDDCVATRLNEEANGWTP
jgi:hypothetical protein